MNLHKLTQKHKEIALMKLRGDNVIEIARKFKMHPWSVYRILEDPKVREYINKVGLLRCRVFIDRMFEQDMRLIRDKRKQRLRKSQV